MLILNYHVAIATFVVVVLHTLIMDMNVIVILSFQWFL